MAVLSVEFAQLYRPSGPCTIKKNAPAQKPAHKDLQKNTVLACIIHELWHKSIFSFFDVDSKDITASRMRNAGALVEKTLQAQFCMCRG
jgi:hypothetical protein